MRTLNNLHRLKNLDYLLGWSDHCVLIDPHGFDTLWMGYTLVAGMGLLLSCGSGWRRGTLVG